MTSAQIYGRAFRSVEATDGFAPVTVEGAVPPDLRGTFWRNGPGQFELFGRPYRHWFDADGAVTAVRFADGGVRVASRLAECPQLARERAAGRAIYASGQTRASWWRMVGGRGKAVRNINTLHWQGQTYALAEGAMPIPIDEATLASGTPRALADDMASFHAHHRTDPRTGTVYGFGVEFGRTWGLSVYRLGADGRSARMVRIPLPDPRILVHDIAFVGSALVVLVHPIGLKLLPLMAGLKAPLECLTWSPDAGSEVLVVPLADPAAFRRFSVPAFYHFHFGNGFVDGDRMHVDLCRMDWLDWEADFTLDAMRRGDLPSMQPTRFARMSLRGEAMDLTLISEAECEFPAIDPRRAGVRHRYTWMVEGEHNIGQLARFDHETGRWARPPLGDSIFPGEPTLVPRGEAEDAVWVLAQAYDGERERTGVVVLDGARPEAPPVARVWFPHHVPPALHGSFVPAAPR